MGNYRTLIKKTTQRNFIEVCKKLRMHPELGQKLKNLYLK